MKYGTKRICTEISLTVLSDCLRGSVINCQDHSPHTYLRGFDTHNVLLPDLGGFDHRPILEAMTDLVPRTMSHKPISGTMSYITLL